MLWRWRKKHELKDQEKETPPREQTETWPQLNGTTQEKKFGKLRIKWNVVHGGQRSVKLGSPLCPRSVDPSGTGSAGVSLVWVLRRCVGAQLIWRSRITARFWAAGELMKFQWKDQRQHDGVLRTTYLFLCPGMCVQMWTTFSGEMSSRRIFRWKKIITIVWGSFFVLSTGG